MQIQTHIDINAAPERVWAILTDLPAHEEWNPFIRTISGEVQEGARLRVIMSPPEGEPMSFRPTVTRASAPGEGGSEPGTFSWLGTAGAGWIFRGEHRFRLEPLDGGTRFHHGEDFGGLLVPLLRKSLDTDTRRGFQAVNRAIKARAELRG